MEHIAELYHSDGYLDARVGPGQVERIGQNRSAVLIPVVEGPRTLVHQVAIRGAEALPARELLLAASYRRISPSATSCSSRRAAACWMPIRSTATCSQRRDRRALQRRPHARRGRVRVVERFPVHIRQIVVQGAVRTDEDLIRRVIRFQRGDLFRPSVAARERARARPAAGVLGRLDHAQGAGATLARQDLAGDGQRTTHPMGGLQRGLEHRPRGARRLRVRLPQPVRSGGAAEPARAVRVSAVRRSRDSGAPQRIVRGRPARAPDYARHHHPAPAGSRVRTSLDLVHLRSNDATSASANMRSG